MLRAIKRAKYEPLKIRPSTVTNFVEVLLISPLKSTVTVKRIPQNSASILAWFSGDFFFIVAPHCKKHKIPGQNHQSENIIFEIDEMNKARKLQFLGINS